MLAEIITIGDELLIGQVIDTNSAWIAQKLNEIGIRVFQISSVSDNEKHILQALDEASLRANIILITGGLGPTKDDITKKTLIKYFNSGIKFDQPSYELIEKIFQSRGREVTEINKNQAEVPDNCTVLLNLRGTAPGMMFESNEKVYFSLPGVPNEMMGLMESSVIPELKERFKLTPIVHKTVLTQGIGESFLSEKIADWEDSLPKNIKLAYLPGKGLLRLRLTGIGTNESKLKKEIDAEVSKLQTIVPEYIYGYDEQRLEEIVGELLRVQKKTISTAESCTGGYIAHRLTTVSGSSEYYMGSVIAYSNLIKMKQLEVDMSLIEKYGAVSEPVVRQMAHHAMRLFNTDCSIACSGIAGPTGGTTEKPVGTVWIAIGTHDEIFTKKLQLGNFRERVIRETALNAMNMLRKVLLGESI